METLDLLGAAVAVTFFILAILVFTFRLLGKLHCAHMVGYLEFFLAIPLVFLLLEAPRFGRPVLYYIQVICMLAFLLVMALLDYIFKIDFRSTRWMVIGFVMLFFAGSGGLLGIAVNAGTNWSIAAVILFLTMGVLAFVQRARTGM